MQYMDRNLDILCTTWTIHWTVAVKHGLFSWTSIVNYGRLLCENLDAENMQNMDVQNVKTWTWKTCKTWTSKM